MANFAETANVPLSIRLCTQITREFDVSDRKVDHKAKSRLFGQYKAILMAVFQAGYCCLTDL